MTKNEDKATFDTLNVQSELEDTNRALREITLMIEQSQGELTKLTQRNASITTHLQQVQGHLRQTTPEEIQMAYDSALDAQQRLFVMRGQLEKLQNDKQHLEKYKNVLEHSGSNPQSESGLTSAAGKNSAVDVEMIVNAQEAERQRLSR